MANVDNISIDLPAPRDDEPASLRTDIVDELADHLLCALNRELHAPASGGRQAADSDPATAARDRALSRFGNPSTIARRLWCDAMKEKIMNQRMTIAVLVVLVLISAGTFAVSWEMVRDSRELNRELIAELHNLAAASAAQASAPTQPAEWNRLQVHCVFDTDDGPPAEGVRVSMKSASENTKAIPPSEEASDADGMIDFGLVLYGSYQINATAPTGETHERTVTVRPGMDRTETIVCPSKPAAETTVSLQVVLPESVSIPNKVRENLWLYCDLFYTGRDISDGHWYPLAENRDRWFLISGADGQAIEWNPKWERFRPEDFRPSRTPAQHVGELFLPPEATATDTIRCVVGEYRVGPYLAVEETEVSLDSNARDFWFHTEGTTLVSGYRPGSDGSFFAATPDMPNSWTFEVIDYRTGEQLAQLVEGD